MRILHFNRKTGEVRIRVDTVDDLWYLYNVVRPGDLVFGHSRWKEEADETGGKARRITIRVGVRVKKTEFQEFSDRLRIMGIVEHGPEDVVGRHHSINVSPGDEISIRKERWSRSDMEELRKAEEETRRPMVAIVSIDDEIGTVALLRSSGVQEAVTVRRAKTGKDYESSDDEADFLREVCEALRGVWSDGMPVIVCGPGFVKERFSSLLKTEGIPHVLAQSSYAGMRGVYEVIKSGSLEKVLKEQRAYVENALVERVLTEIRKNGPVAYGLDEVRRCAEMGAVETLLVSDRVYREGEVLDIMRAVESAGGRVHIISTGHEGGRILQNLGGVAALLRFTVQPPENTG